MGHFEIWHSNNTFHDLDNYVFDLCWRWIHRLHPNKNNHWKKQRYFHKLQKYGINNHWVFTDPETGIFLYQLKWTGIVRHIMIRNNARPDDREDKEYFNDLRNMRSNNTRFFFSSLTH
jgi:RNA-directed DNA polymerase